MFPLRLTPFEEYFFFKDTIDNPSVQALELELSGPLNRATTQAAAEWSAQQNPLLNCRIECVGKKAYWVPIDTPPTIDWHESPISFSELETTFLDITKSPGVKLIAFDGRLEDGIEQNAKLIFLVHHSAADGLGAIRSAVDFLQAYRDLQQQQQHVSRYELPRLKQRCRSRLGFGDRLRLLPGQWLSIRETARVLKRKTIPLVPWSPPCRDKATGRKPSCTTITFNRDESTRLRKRTRAANVGLNQWALHCWFKAISSWHNKREPTESANSGTHFRIMVPINERVRQDRLMPACNHCTFVNFDFTNEEIIGAEPSLLEEIQRTFFVISRWRLSLNLWRAFRVFRWMPGGLKKLARRDDVTATALFTNVGRVLQKFTQSDRTATKAGEQSDQDKNRPLLSLASAAVFPPLQRGMLLAIVMYSFNHELRISLQFDERFIGKLELDNLLKSFRAELLAEIDSI